MSNPEDLPQRVLPIGLSLTGYKSYRSVTRQLKNIYPINVLIGKNNSGKTALLEVLEYLINPTEGLQSRRLSGAPPTIYCRFTIERRHIEMTVPPNVGGGTINGNHLKVCLQYVGQEICLVIQHPEPPKYFEEGLAFPEQYRDILATKFEIPLHARKTKSVLAERDVRPESPRQLSVAGNGEGLTNALQLVINDATKNSALIEVELLNAINDVLDTDTQIRRLLTQTLTGSSDWEIYLESTNGSPVALSASGSGLKTILLTSYQLLIGPIVEDAPIGHFVFFLEELENNIHPGLLRRLFQVVRRAADDHGAYVFIATHSNVVLDMFSTDPIAQIIHVTKTGADSDIEVVSSLKGLHGVLNDLDIRASDLLQSNGVIWVEGPSDRVYLNRFIDLWTRGKLREGTHYQIVFYGGRLLNGLTADENNDDLINLIRINRNAYLVVDRDTEAPNSTKLRLIEEVTGSGGGTWVSSRKEIECDLPIETLNRDGNSGE